MVRCGVRQNCWDFIIDLQPSINKCANIENQIPTAERKLNAYIDDALDDVLQSMITESLRRYNAKFANEFREYLLNK